MGIRDIDAVLGSQCWSPWHLSWMAFPSPVFLHQTEISFTPHWDSYLRFGASDDQQHHAILAHPDACTIPISYAKFLPRHCLQHQPPSLAKQKILLDLFYNSWYAGQQLGWHFLHMWFHGDMATPYIRHTLLHKSTKGKSSYPNSFNHFLCMSIILTTASSWKAVLKLSICMHVISVWLNHPSSKGCYLSHVYCNLPYQ